MIRHHSGGDRTAPPQYLRNRSNTRVRKIRRARTLARFGVIAACWAVLLGVLIQGGVGLARRAWSSREFGLARIDVAGQRRASAEAIRAALGDWRGTSLLALDLAEVVARVERVDWVRTARVRKVLPDALEVSIEERVPAALALVGGQVLVVDTTGQRIGALGPGLTDSLPVLQGVDARDPALVAARLRAGALALGGIERASPTFARSISEIDLSRPDRVAVRTIDGSPWILLDPERVERNLSAFLELRREIERRLGPADYVDLRWQDHIAVLPTSQSSEGEDG